MMWAAQALNMAYERVLLLSKEQDDKLRPWAANTATQPAKASKANPWAGPIPKGPRAQAYARARQARAGAG